MRVADLWGGAVRVVGAVLVVGAVGGAVVAGARVPVAGVLAPSAAVTGPPLRIMPLGSSSTVGTGSPGTAGFREPLEAMLTRDRIDFVMVGSQQSGPPWMIDRRHEGHGGTTMAQMLPLTAGWIRAQHPDVVLLQVGTNDLNTGVGAPATANRLDAMLTAIHATAPTAEVIVAGVWAPLRTHAQARAEFARLAAEVVARHRGSGEPTEFVDTSTLLGTGDLFDGLHPNASGYGKIAVVWEREIRSWLGRLPPVDDAATPAAVRLRPLTQ